MSYLQFLQMIHASGYLDSKIVQLSVIHNVLKTAIDHPC